MLCSLQKNNIGGEGASALAAILKETKITNLECTAARAFAFVSMPVDTHLFSLTALTHLLQSRVQ